MRLETCNLGLNILDIRDQRLYPLDVSFFNKLGGSEASFPIRRLFRQDMPSKSPFGLDFPRPCLFEAFCCPSVRF
jgi:hypothetical protein